MHLFCPLFYSLFFLLTLRRVFIFDTQAKGACAKNANSERTAYFAFYTRFVYRLLFDTRWVTGAYNVHFFVMLTRIRALDIIPVEQVIWFDLCACVCMYTCVCVSACLCTFGCYHICFDLENKYFIKYITFFLLVFAVCYSLLANGFQSNLEKYTESSA